MSGERIVIVGSGPSAVHFALTVLRQSHDVTMLDVGYEKPAAIAPQASLAGLKSELSDPAEYFLGRNFEGVLLPGAKGEYYGIPPSKEYVFRTPAGGFSLASQGFAPLFSFAQGGLAQAWTAGCYPFNDAELEDFPFSYAQLGPCYDEVARRIGVTGAPDDLARFFPLHAHLMEPLRLDRHSALLLEQYEKHKPRLNSMGCYVGRTRVATLSRDLGSRKACDYRGRCLWGCPTDSLYTPALTLAECRSFPNFRYAGGLRVTHFRFDTVGRVTRVIAEPAAGGEPQGFDVGKLVLAAGALSSTRIFLESIYRDSGERVKLGGLMDNRQILVPFVNLRLLGKSYDPQSYQYHLLGMGVEMGSAKEYVHGQITTLKTGMVHPIMQNLPCDLRTAGFLVRNLHAALGIVNVNHHDTPRPENYVTLETATPGGTGAQSGAADGAPARLAIHYAPPESEAAFLRRSVGTVKKALRRLGCMVPPGMAHVRPMGASAHYAGTLAMSREKKAYTTSEYGQSREFENLYVADGATFPFLPAKNITFTLMANAVRIAQAAFQR